MFRTEESFSAISFAKAATKPICVVKYGGAIAENKEAMLENGRQIWRLVNEGVCGLVIVHGGKHAIDEEMKKRGLIVRRDPFSNARITDLAAVRACDLALCNLTREVVGWINEAAQGVGDGDVDKVRTRPFVVGMPAYGQKMVLAVPFSEREDDYAGLVRSVNPDFMRFLLKKGHIPVINSMSWNASNVREERKLNVNADDVAIAVAEALGAKQVLFCSGVAGVVGGDGNKIDQLALDEAENLMAKGVIKDGMKPKVLAAMKAAERLQGGGRILDGRAPDAVYNAVKHGIGGTRVATLGF